MEERKKPKYYIRLVEKIQQNEIDHFDELLDENPKYQKLRALVLLVKSKLRH